MPPVVPRKRLKTDSPKPEPSSKRAATRTASHHSTRNATRRNRESVFQTLDTPPTVSRTLSQTKALLEQEDDDSSLTDLESSDDEFEHVISNTPQPPSSKGKAKQKAQDGESSTDETWEDALGAQGPVTTEEPIITDIQIDMSSIPVQSAFASNATGKKGPSKIQRQIRYHAHCLHVQSLLFHNALRNAWIQDKDVQRTLVSSLNIGSWKEVQRYWRDSGISDGPERLVDGVWTEKIAKQLGFQGEWRETGKNGVKEYTPSPGKGSGKKAPKASPSTPRKTGAPPGDRKQRDWSTASERLEPDTPNLSAGDPTLRLLQYLSKYWKSRFKITTPCLRKRGYQPPEALEAEIKAWKKNPSVAKHFGERIESRDHFRDLARKCEGSRDVGQQLFTALVRGLGLEARMIASLQPLGFGWNQLEEGKPKNLDLEMERPESETVRSGKAVSKASPVKPARAAQAVDGSRTLPINLSDDDSSGLSSVDSSDSDIDRTPAKIFAKPKQFGEELPYPTYWTEVISHLKHTPISVSPLPRTIIGTSSSPDGLAGFYCRGAAADRAKQVFAYIIAFSSDRTAKDVTTRYLPKQQWPGKTKGYRVPVENVPIYNKHGKVRRYEEWDWFESVLRPYARRYSQRQPWDEIEEQGDLVPKQPDKPKHMDEGGKETLQGYKESAEYVLERHLRREEALKPGAKVVRYFKTGKGDKEKQEAVYARKDVVPCKSVESWHKEGREVKEGEQPLKYVPMRAVTIIRKREIEEREREEGAKVKQALYSRDQTDWIIPDPIQDGKIPRNAFGNIDVYVPTMVPKGAVHIRKKGTAKICRKLGIDYAEACTGFEFGKQRAVPVLTGVVVAAENKDLVLDAWRVAEAERLEKEQKKKDALVLGLWKKFLVGLRVVERMRQEYGDEIELPKGPVLDMTAAPKKSEWDVFQGHGTDFEGGFIREDANPSGELPGGFIQDPLSSQTRQEGRDTTLTIDHGDEPKMDMDTPTGSSHRTPISLSAAFQQVEEASMDGNSNDDEDLGAPLPSASAPSPRPEKRTTKARTKKRIRQSRATEEFSEESSSPKAPSSARPSSDAEDRNRPVLREDSQDNSPAPPTRTRPRRKAAMRSNAKVRSHYFAHERDDDLE